MSASSPNVIVLLSNAAYSRNCLMTIRGCRRVGNYTGDIVVLVDDEMPDDFLEEAEQFGVIIRHYDPIDIEPILSKIREHPFTCTDGRELTKQIQWQKLNIFDVYFKQWEKIFYMDAGMHVMGDIGIFFDLVRPGIVLAHCDDFPEYSANLAGQFDRLSQPGAFKELSEKYRLDRQCFQTGILLFESSMVGPTTVREIMDLAYRYPISRTNEQGILNLYFCEALRQVPIYTGGKFLYDYWERFGHTRNEYLLLKYPIT